MVSDFERLLKAEENTPIDYFIDEIKDYPEVRHVAKTFLEMKSYKIKPVSEALGLTEKQTRNRIERACSLLNLEEVGIAALQIAYMKFLEEEVRMYEEAEQMKRDGRL